MFLFLGHSGLSSATGADSWGVPWLGVALDSDVAHGGGRSRGAGGSCGAGWVII
jgi:hypothetical protein